jgi:hypothetical protein
MTLKYALDNLDGLDDAVKALYKESDGGFVLDVDGVVPKARFDEVNQRAVDATDEAARRRKTVERVVKRLGLEDASKLDDTLDGLLSKGKGKTDDEVQELIAQIKDGAAKETAGVRDALTGVISGYAKGALKAEMLAAGFHPEIADDITASAMARVKIDESGKSVILTADGKPLAGSGADSMATFGDLAKEFAAAKPSFLVDKGKGGGGKPPAGGSGAGQKTVTRSEFDGMSHADRADFSKNGGKVVD